MVYCVDVDDVICNLQETIIESFNKRFGTKYTLENFVKYDIMDVLPDTDAIVMKGMYKESGLYNKVKPIPGAQNVLQKLINQGHQVYLVTNAAPSTYGEKVLFIKK
jgi:5'(3')-deoxyribonucleotidase